MVASERATLAEFKVVLPLLERFFAEEGLNTHGRRAGGLRSLHICSQSVQDGQMTGRKRKQHE